jgi:hypothetical protein
MKFVKLNGNPIRSYYTPSPEYDSHYNAELIRCIRIVQVKSSHPDDKYIWAVKVNVEGASVELNGEEVDLEYGDRFHILGSY